MAHRTPAPVLYFTARVETPSLYICRKPLPVSSMLPWSRGNSKMCRGMKITRTLCGHADWVVAGLCAGEEAGSVYTSTVRESRPGCCADCLLHLAKVRALTISATREVETSPGGRAGRGGRCRICKSRSRGTTKEPELRPFSILGCGRTSLGRFDASSQFPFCAERMLVKNDPGRRTPIQYGRGNRINWNQFNVDGMELPLWLHVVEHKPPCWTTNREA